VKKYQPEKKLTEAGYRYVAGIDEAGRGPLAGPVVASAVIFPQNWIYPGIKDSKKLSPKKRQQLFSVIKKNAVAWSWALVDAQEIDRINILQASLLAMKKAAESLLINPDYIIVDGNHSISVTTPQTAIIKGDERSHTIAAASIMAKVVRDSIMCKYHVIYPEYNFATHKGYGTRQHLETLRVHGCCFIHRKTFRGVVGTE
jgi:ribonuclease HII